MVGAVALARCFRAKSHRCLEELDNCIEPVADTVEVMEAIQKQWSKLSAINFENLKDVMERGGQETDSKLIRSYGSRLRQANTGELDQKQLMEVVKACTNLEFAVY